MKIRFFALAVVTAAVLLPAALTIPALAADNDTDDQKVTVRIKIALAGDNSLSAQAHEVSVATNQQAVVLRGSVLPGEKDRIESLAEQYAGTRQVVDQLLVRDM